jgi:hypothetical protein
LGVTWRIFWQFSWHFLGINNHLFAWQLLQSVSMASLFFNKPLWANWKLLQVAGLLGTCSSLALKSCLLILAMVSWLLLAANSMVINW